MERKYRICTIILQVLLSTTWNQYCEGEDIEEMFWVLSYGNFYKYTVSFCIE